VTSATAVPAAALPLDRDTVERFGTERGEPEWLRRGRLAAAARFTPDLWPTGQEEEWRRFPPREIPASPLVGARSTVTHTREGLPGGVFFGPLEVAVRERPDLVEARLGEGEGEGLRTHAAFRAAAEALWSTGTFLYVPAGVSIDVPLVAERVWAGGDEALLSRTIVVAERDSEVTFVEDTSSIGGGGRRSAIPLVDVHLGPGARVRTVLVQRLAEDVWDIGTQRYLSERGSQLASFNVLVGSGRTKLGVGSDIVGDRAEVKMYGLVAATGTQRIDVNSLQRLDGKASQSDLLYLSALYGSAKAVYYGVIRVEPTSRGSGSYQECRNLLLSDKAGAVPIPVLEILTNDVARCGHGATAGRIDEEEVFYVMSRGIDRRTSEQLLVRGFFQRVVDRIPDVGIRARVLEALRPRIGRAADLDLQAA